MSTYDELSAEWRAGMTLAATRFRLAHPVEYRSMLDGVMIGYKRGDVGGFDRRMAQLERSCAFAEGWPQFDLWLQAHPSSRPATTEAA